MSDLVRFTSASFFAVLFKKILQQLESEARRPPAEIGADATP